MKDFLKTRIKELEQAKRETNIMIVIEAINRVINKHKKQIQYVESKNN